MRTLATTKKVIIFRAWPRKDTNSDARQITVSLRHQALNERDRVISYNFIDKMNECLEVTVNSRAFHSGC